MYPHYNKEHLGTKSRAVTICEETTMKGRGLQGAKGTLQSSYYTNTFDTKIV